MFSKANRLDRTAFAHAYTRGVRAQTAGLTLIWYVAPLHKAAVVVGRKVAGSAVARNRLKRWLYAALREARMQSGHIIVLAKPALRDYSRARLCAELTVGLGRLIGRMAPSR